MITRRIQPILLRQAARFPVVTVTGPRQAGKTTLCRMAFPDRQYVSLEDPDERRFAQTDPRGFLGGLSEGAIIDEVQRVPEVLSYLQAIVDANPAPGRFILTGSANMALHAEVSQSLAGRTTMLELLPFDLEERSQIAEPDDRWQAAWQGSYPAIFDRGFAAGEWLAAYVATYVERDLRQLKAVASLRTFQSFMELCAAHTGQLVNLSALGEGVGVSHNTARAWLSVLQAGYLIQVLPPLHRNLKKRVIKSPKLHFIDTGLACWLLGIRSPSELARHPLRGALFGSWVASEVRKARTHRGQRPRIYHWRDRRGAEVDLVIDRGTELVAVEVKSGETIDPSFLKQLLRFDALVDDAVPPVPDGVRPILIAGGGRRRRHGRAEVVPWEQVQSVDWV